MVQREDEAVNGMGQWSSYPEDNRNEGLKPDICKDKNETMEKAIKGKGEQSEGYDTSY